jgi:hypothetical protein
MSQCSSITHLSVIILAVQRSPVSSRSSLQFGAIVVVHSNVPTERTLIPDFAPRISKTSSIYIIPCRAAWWSFGSQPQMAETLEGECKHKSIFPSSLVVFWRWKIRAAYLPPSPLSRSKQPGVVNPPLFRHHIRTSTAEQSTPQ